MNSIYIQNSGWDSPLEIPIMDDFSIEAKTEFKTFRELVPLVDQITTILTTATTLGGTESKGTMKINSMLDAIRWGGSDPIRISTSLHFYLKDDPLKDVIKPMNLLLGLHLIKRSKDGKSFNIPGVNTKNMSKVLIKDKAKPKKEQTGRQIRTANKLAKKTKDDLAKKMENLTDSNSLISVLIPGVVYIDNAVMYSIEPTYSKQVTDNGYPLWATAQVQIVGVRPALLDDFIMGSKMYFDGNIVEGE